MEKEQLETFHQRSPGRRLAMLSRLSMAYMAGPLADMGIGRGKIGFLLSVLQFEGIVQEELTNRLCIDRAATARALQALEDQGLVRREEDRKDRRKKRVFSTGKARALQPELMEMLTRHNEALFSGLTRSEQDQFLDMLDRLVDNLRGAVEGGSR
jgi:DNA-binding MarR family transcriptional regulator